MKKLTLLTATVLTVACMGANTLTTMAAEPGRIIIGYGSCGDLQSLKDKLAACFPGIIFPENNRPETETPDINIPEADLPDNGGSSNDNMTEDTTPETKPEEDSSGDATEHAYIRQVVDLVNAERTKAGLTELKVDAKVQAAAQVRAVECEQRFAHTRPNGSSFATALTEQKVSYRSAGENIAWGQRSPQEVVTAWMNSEGHRANIMNAKFTTIGVGYYQNANGTNYWCQLFTR